ncbi:MAG: peptide-N-glycosidase [Marinilabiliales bacterium]|nr:MAG: peptide-N-glycosidase [Marinilabiliales bacterium]
MKYLESVLLPFLLLICLSICAQPKKTTAYKISYIQYSNNNTADCDTFNIYYFDGVCFLTDNKGSISQYIDINRGLNVDIIVKDNEYYKTTQSISDNPKPIEISDEKKKINEYKSKKATYNSFSNKIEVWFTDKANVYGSPYQRFFPNTESLVTKIVVNNNRTIDLIDIIKVSNYDLPDYYFDAAMEITDPEFEELKILSRYEVVPVFENDRINFDTELEKINPEEVDGLETLHLSNGGIIFKKVKLPQMAKEGAYCFAKLTVRSDGDAYDRTGSVFIIPDSQKDGLMFNSLFQGPDILPVFVDKLGNEYQGYMAENDFNPAIEIMRFFTSFGAGHFNDKRPINNYNWEPEVIYKREVTELIPDNEDYIWVGVFIGNYDKNGHIVDLELDFYPPYDESDSKKFIKPLFNTVNIMEMNSQNYCRFFKTYTLRMKFELPEGVENPQLVFTTTGHGGWETGDEFVPKLNEILVDGEKVFEIVPWLTDCATYRLNNPASGNFGNGLSSSDFSRSNWCPGTLTPPYYVKLEMLSSGNHTIEVIIDQGEDEGSSFSSWSVSGILVGTIIKE